MLDMVEDELVSEARAPDVLAHLPCPVKVPLEQAIQEWREERVGSMPSDAALDLCIEGNANKSREDYAALVSHETPATFPSLVLTSGVNQLFGRRFLMQVLDTGAFEDAADYPSGERAESAFRDPLGHATVLAVNATVMVVDKRELGHLPVPRSWAELARPVYARSVVMPYFFARTIRRAESVSSVKASPEREFAASSTARAASSGSRTPRLSAWRTVNALTCSAR
jgi:hypothetical protein